MGYMIADELRKLWQRKTFLLMLVVVVMANLALTVYQDRQSEAQNSAYKKIDARFEKCSQKERVQYLEEYQEKIEGMMLVENIQMYEMSDEIYLQEAAQSMRRENAVVYEKYFPEWEKGSSSLYTKNLYAEKSFIENLTEKLQLPLHYREFQKGIAQKEEQTLEISIFADSVKDSSEATFSQKVIRKTAEKYSRIAHTKTNVYTYRWLEQLQPKEITHLLLFIMMFILVYQMIYEEKRKKLFVIIRAMPRGRAECMISKMVALFINTGAVMLLLYGAVFGYSIITAGIDGWNETVQSAGIFVTCPYPLRVWQFLCLALALQWIGLYIFGLMLLLIGIFVSHYIITFAVGIAIVGVSALQYYFVSGVSKWNGFHYLNLWQFVRSQEIIGNYVLLDFGGKPISVCMMMGVLLGVMLIALMIACVVMFCNRADRWSEKSVSVLFVERIKRRMQGRHRPQRIYKRVWSYESDKILKMNLGIVIIVIFVVAMGINAKNTDCYLSPNDANYRQWLQHLSGTLTTEKEEKILRQKEYYDDIFRQIEQIENMAAQEKGDKSRYETEKMMLESRLVFYPSFQKVYERYLYVKEDAGRQFVYEQGYYKLLGKKDSQYIKMYLLMAITLILLLSTVFTSDKEKGMYHLLRTTVRGRDEVNKAKLVISLFCVLTIYLSFLLRNFYIAQTNYGMNLWSVPASNLYGFANMPSYISIAVLVIGYIIGQVIVLCAVAAVILAVSARIGNTVHAIVWESIGLIICAVIINQLYPFLY